MRRVRRFVAASALTAAALGAAAAPVDATNTTWVSGRTGYGRSTHMVAFRVKVWCQTGVTGSWRTSGLYLQNETGSVTCPSGFALDPRIV